RKATVSSPGDPYEREADDVADRVMRMVEPAPIGSAAATIQRKCAACEDEKKQTIQRRASGAQGPATAPPIVHDVLRSPGQPLGAATRTFMELRFGADFGAVRVHTDEQASASARAVNAMAYTVGSDIVVASDHFSPSTTQGRRLLAHELTHVVQQGGGA